MLVRFPPHLQRFVEIPDSCEIDARSLGELLDSIESLYPGTTAYIVHENGKLRQHVNLFLDGRVVSDREKLSDDVTNVSEVVIMQALSGG